MKRRLGLHIAFWVAYWFIFSYVYSRYDGEWGKYAVTEGIQMPFRMLATYLAFWSVDRFRAPWAAFTGVALAVFIGGLLTRVAKMVYLVPVWFPTSTFDFWGYRLMVDVFDCALAAGAALTARLYFRQQAAAQREAVLRSEKTEAELQALKNQLHPHFLFNTINNLYGLARVQSPQTAPAALQLAQLLRYVLYDAAAPTVPIEQEIALLRDYIALEKLRFDPERLSVHMTATLDFPQQPIMPLVLLPLVENAFKHGASEQREAWITVAVCLEAGTLDIRIENSKTNNPPVQNGGIGLDNLRRRLQLLCPQSHDLRMEDLGDRYLAQLRLWNLPAAPTIV